MHLLFLQLATQSLFACRWGISVGLRLGVRHLAFFLSFFALSSSLITLFLSKKKKITLLTMIYRFYFFFNLLDKSLGAARQTIWLYLCSLLLSYMKSEISLLCSVQLAMHISFVQKRDVCCDSLLGGLETFV